MSEKKKLSAKAIVADIKAGLTDSALVEKYGISSEDLAKVFKKLIDAGLITEQDIRSRNREDEKTTQIFKCPSCGMPQITKKEVCSDCGVISEKFKNKQGQNKIDEPKTTPVSSLRTLVGETLKDDVTKAKELNAKAGSLVKQTLKKDSTLKWIVRIAIPIIVVFIGVSVYWFLSYKRELMPVEARGKIDDMVELCERDYYLDGRDKKVERRLERIANSYKETPGVSLFVARSILSNIYRNVCEYEQANSDESRQKLVNLIQGGLFWLRGDCGVSSLCAPRIGSVLTDWSSKSVVNQKEVTINVSSRNGKIWLDFGHFRDLKL